MVIGSGMVASAFLRYSHIDDVLVFASGVSYSGETNMFQFEREILTLKKAMGSNPDALLVYFSTCSADDADICMSPYVQHKLRMEQIIRDDQKRYLICRLPQVVGRSLNKTTLVNYLYDNIVNKKEFAIWRNTVRYLIDIEDVARIVGYLIDNRLYYNSIVNISALSYSVEDIVKALERITGIKAQYILLEKGLPYRIDNSKITPLIDKLNLTFDNDYLFSVLNKYYGSHVKH